MNFYVLEKYVRIVEYSFYSMMIRYLKIILCVGNVDWRIFLVVWLVVKFLNVGVIILLL